MYTKTEGIILREVELGEADKLIDILTREQGVLTARAKGVRRAKSPLKSACQLLTYSEFTLFEYRGKHTVQEAEPIEQFRPLRDDIELLALGSYFAQASAMISQADAPNPELLSLLLNALYALGMLRKPQLLVKAAFELRLACIAGFAPEVSACAECGAEAPDRFDLSQGTMTCAGCRNGPDSGIRYPVSDAMRYAMQYICWCDPKKLFSFQLGEEALRSLSSLTEAYLMTQLEHSFYTLDFYKSLLQYDNLEPES